jgi:CBS domain-containing protein
MSVGEFCNREVIIVEKQESVIEAAKLMRQHHVGDVVVVEEKEDMNIPVGIVTDRDIVVEVLAEDVEPASVAVADIMSGELATAREEDELLETIKYMRSRAVRRLPVVDARGALVGILTVDDVLDLVAEQLSDLVGLATGEQYRESKTRGWLIK